MLRLLFILVFFASVPALAQDAAAPQEQEAPPCTPTPPDYGDKAGATLKRYERRQVEINQMDKDCDGILDAEEREKAVEQRFDDADANKDGIISESEAAAMAEQYKSEEGYGGLTDRNIRQYERNVEAIDKNNDGIISDEEYKAYYNSRYEGLDKDGDGLINADEYRYDAETSRRKKRRNRKDRDD